MSGKTAEHANAGYGLTIADGAFSSSQAMMDSDQLLPVQAIVRAAIRVNTDEILAAEATREATENRKNAS